MTCRLCFCDISVADPGCLSQIRLFSILYPTFFHPGSWTVSIPDPGSSSKNLSILTPKKAKKWFLSSKKYDTGCSSRIRMLTFSHPGSRIQGSKKYSIPDPGSATLCDMYREDDFMFHDRLTTVWWRLNFRTFKCFLMSSLVITRFDLPGIYKIVMSFAVWVWGWEKTWTWEI